MNAGIIGGVCVTRVSPEIRRRKALGRTQQRHIGRARNVDRFSHQIGKFRNGTRNRFCRMAKRRLECDTFLVKTCDNVGSPETTHTLTHKLTESWAPGNPEPDTAAIRPNAVADCTASTLWTQCAEQCWTRALCWNVMLPFRHGHFDMIDWKPNKMGHRNFACDCHLPKIGHRISLSRTQNRKALADGYRVLYEFLHEWNFGRCTTDWFCMVRIERLV